MWRISALDNDFLDGRVTLPSHAVIYNGDVIGFDERKRIHITDIDPRGALFTPRADLDQARGRGGS